MPSPEMISYDPLLPPSQDSRMGYTPRKEKTVYHFEEISRIRLLVGVFFVLPLYFYLLPNLLLVPVVTEICSVFSVTDPEIAALILNVLFDSIILLMLLLLFAPVLRQSVADLRRFSIGHYLKWLGGSFVCFWGVNMVANLLTMAINGGINVSQNQAAVTDMTQTAPVVMFILTVIVAPFMEELLFRGIIYRTLRRLGVFPAALVSGLSFGLMHVISYITAGDLSELVMIIPYAAMGFSLSLIYEKRKNMFLNIGVHMMQNLLGILIVLLFTHLGFY